MFLNLKYRFNYIQRFIKNAKILGLSVSYKLLKAGFDGANPKIFVDSSGEYYFNRLIASYFDRFQKEYLAKRYREISLGEYDIKLLAINYHILSQTGLNILKYLPHLSYSSRRKMNEYLYKLKDITDF